MQRLQSQDIEGLRARIEAALQLVDPTEPLYAELSAGRQGLERELLRAMRPPPQAVAPNAQLVEIVDARSLPMLETGKQARVDMVNDGTVIVRIDPQAILRSFGQHQGGA